ncbi:MAG: LysE family transporter [Anaerolineae bacterium]|nr:LysE family transporter [Anaerolineae bacterium]
MTEYILSGLLLGFAAAAQPGPFQTYLIAQAVSYGWRKTWVAALAPLLSDGPIILLTLFALNQIPTWLQRGLNVAGGLFILYLAWGAFRKWQDFGSLEIGTAPQAGHSLLKAAFMNMLSPVPYIYWSLVTGPILLAGLHVSPLHGLSFLLSFYLVLVGGFLALMAIFSAASRPGNRANRILIGISAVVLAGFGVFQLLRGLVPELYKM